MLFMHFKENCFQSGISLWMKCLLLCNNKTIKYFLIDKFYLNYNKSTWVFWIFQKVNKKNMYYFNFEIFIGFQIHLLYFFLFLTFAHFNTWSDSKTVFLANKIFWKKIELRLEIAFKIFQYIIAFQIWKLVFI